jgi:CheY-like chemotaxis protein
MSDAAGPLPATRAGDDETVLVVEDRPAVRTVVTKALRAQGYTVLEAANGENALEMASRHPWPIDLVLTDVVMPVMSGTQLVDKLRGWYPRLRVIFMSGYTEGRVSATQVDDARTGFLSKPFLVEELATMVRQLLDS